MIVVFPRSGQPIPIPNGAAVKHATLPASAAQVANGEQPAATLEVLTATGVVLAVFRSRHVSGWDVSQAGADAQ